MDQHLYSILKSYHENRLAHAFLIETNSQELCFQALKKIIKQLNCETNYTENCEKCNLCSLVENDSLPSFVVIKPDGQMIKKEQVLNLKQKFSTKPIYSKFNIYIIMNAEKLNSSSANSILKFLEEPEEGILGFFLTNNKENIIDTIKSRCQIIGDYYDTSQIIPTDIQKKAIDYLREVHLSKEMALVYNKNILLNFDLSKEDFQNLFHNILEIYFDFYKTSLGLKELKSDYNELKFLLKKDNNYFLSQIKLIEELEQELGFNVNMNLLLDRFVLESR